MRARPGLSALLVCLFAAGPLVAPPAIVHAQESATLATARIAARKGARVNVRAEPEVREGNVVGVASGGDALTVLEVTERGAYAWYRVRDLEGDVEGWVRGDLIEITGEAAALEIAPPAAVADETPAAATIAPAAPAPVAEGRPPFEEREDWSRNIFNLYKAIDDCVRISSAQPAVVERAYNINRGMADIVVFDAAGRRWDCIIRDVGGTPMRFDPVSGSLDPNDTINPTFHPSYGGKPEEDACTSIEEVRRPGTDNLLGWLVYKICR